MTPVEFHWNSTGMVERSFSGMLNTTNTEFSLVEAWFTDQNSKQPEIEDNVNMTQIIG